MSIPPQTGGVDIAAGRELYTTHCQACHSTQVGYPAFKAPNLHDIGRTAATRKPNLSAAAYILESILDPDAFLAPSGRPGMPSGTVRDLAPDDICNLVGFLAGLGASLDYEEIKRLEIPDCRPEKHDVTTVSYQEMELAEQVLREKGSCLNCHSLYSIPESEIFAPSLFRSGLNDASALRDSLIAPHKKITPQFESVALLLKSGQVVSGRLVTRNDERVLLCTRDAQNQLALREISLADIESENGQLELHQSNRSLMPDGFDKTLTDEEIQALIKLIRQLN
jgi:putative heme-binding domain-containing protein